MDQKYLQDAITLFVVLNPIGAVPLYLGLTRGMDRHERLRVARRACIAATVILIGFIALGELVLDGMGVHLPSFRVAGGLVLLLVALRMVLGSASAIAEGGEETRDVAIFPLATPFLAGPGAIIAAVLLTENDRFSFVEQATTAIVVAAMLALTFLLLACADLLQKLIGTTGAVLMSRVLGLVLAALAMQTMLDGLKPYFQSLH
jgi:multiple antibiotic resistance protein